MPKYVLKGVIDIRFFSLLFLHKYFINFHVLYINISK